MAYGQELILDLKSCDVSTFTRDSIEQYFVELCELIDMERCEMHFWDDEGVPEAEWQTDPKTKGISAIQFILTSSIVIHTLELREEAFVNIFSCKEFDSSPAHYFTVRWFRARESTTHHLPRGWDTFHARHAPHHEDD